MWIMLTKKIVCEVSPPKLAIFWAVPWPNSRFSSADIFDNFGLLPNWDDAQKIRYKETDVRVFPHEFTAISDEHLQLYINEGSHVLMAECVAEQQFIDALLDKEQMGFYDAALVDGAMHAQAMIVAMGGDPTDGSMMPPIGWYKCKPEYSYHFCRDWEMESEDLLKVKKRRILIREKTT